MPSIEATRFKLSEAQFFYAKLVKACNSVVRQYPEELQYYLSAFLSAARSVTFALQAEEKAAYDAWYPEWETTLSEEDVSLWRGFNKERVAAVHKTGANVSHHLVRIPVHEYLAAVSMEGANIEISGPIGEPLGEFNKVVRTFTFSGTESEVADAAGRYLRLLERVINEFTKRYPDSTAA